jgi:DNA mismatch endonuclease (patch repair protein)
MRANRKRDTRPEVALRSILHRAGARFRCDYPIRLEGRRLTRVDIAFPRAKVVVFVDGCFWHRCPEHGSIPASNRHYWKTKLLRNVERDREVDAALLEAGWIPMHVWEHEDSAEAAAQVQRVVDKRRSRT